MSDRERLELALGATKECPPVEELAEFIAADGLDPTRPDASHVARCSRCQAELQMLKTFTASEPLPDEGASVAWISAELERNLSKITGGPSSCRKPVAPFFSWWLQAWKTTPRKPVLAGIALAGVSGLALVLMRPSEPAVVADTRVHDIVTRSEQVAGLKPAGDVPAKPVELRWQAASNWSLYKVDVMEVDESLLWTVQTESTFVALPSKIRDKLLPGKTILWRVTALDANGTVVATSQVERFRLVNEKNN